MTFLIVPDSDVRACRLADRHYSRKTIGSNRMAGPGEHLILITPDADAVIGFRLTRFRLDNQKGVECFIFRNEGKTLSSFLLERACPYVFAKWNHTRLFTYINPSKIKSSNPGCCFKKAGWKLAGTNKFGNLLVFEKYLWFWTTFLKIARTIL